MWSRRRMGRADPDILSSLISIRSSERSRVQHFPDSPYRVDNVARLRRCRQLSRFGWRRVDRLRQLWNSGWVWPRSLNTKNDECTAGHYHELRFRFINAALLKQCVTNPAFVARFARSLLRSTPSCALIAGGSRDWRDARIGYA